MQFVSSYKYKILYNTTANITLCFPKSRISVLLFLACLLFWYDYIIEMVNTKYRVLGEYPLNVVLACTQRQGISPPHRRDWSCCKTRQSLGNISLIVLKLIYYTFWTCMMGHRSFVTAHWPCKLFSHEYSRPLNGFDAVLTPSIFHSFFFVIQPRIGTYRLYKNYIYIFLMIRSY